MIPSIFFDRFLKFQNLKQYILHKHKYKYNKHFSNKYNNIAI